MESSVLLLVDAVELKSIWADFVNFNANVS